LDFSGSMIDTIKKYVKHDDSWKYMPISDLGRFIKGSDRASIFENRKLEPPILTSPRISMTNNYFPNPIKESEFSIYPIDNAEGESELIDRVLNDNSHLDLDPFLESLDKGCNTGYVLYIHPGSKIKEPIYLDNVLELGSNSLLSRIAIVCGEGSYADIFEHRVSKNRGYLNQFSNILCDQAASLNFTLISECKNSAIETSSVVVSKDSSINLNILLLESQLSRTCIKVNLIDNNARANLAGLFIASGNDHIEFHTDMKHNSKNTSSIQNFKGILSDKSSGFFNGLIDISKLGDGSQAIQSNKNIIFGDNARMNSNPQLKINTDDVKCSHGSTTGQIDEDVLFYLRSRGIPLDMAYQMIVAGFSAEVFEQINNSEIKSYIDNAISKSIAKISW